MNVQVIWEGSDITHHVVEYTRQHDICTGIGSLDLIIEADSDFNFNPWNSVIVKEEGTQVALYNITSTEKTSPGGTYIIAAQDNSKRLTDYFIDHEYTVETLSNTRTWIELILSDAGIVDYSINTSSNGEPLTVGSQFGLRPAYDAIINLLQLSGWFMYFDSNGTCQIGELDTNKTPIHDFHDTSTLEIRTIKNDKMLRNRVYVWGSFEDGTGWVTAKAETYLPWFRDDGEDWRSVVYQNSAIYYYSTAIKMAEKMLAEFSRETPEKEIHVVGLHPSLHVGVYIKSLGTYGTGVGQVTSYIVNVNAEGGATTTLIVDKRCPRLFGISDIKSQFVYVGTNDNGVWRKAVDGGYWYAYNTNIESKYIKDLAVYDNLLSAVTLDGDLYINNTGGWLKYDIPTKLPDVLSKSPDGLISTASGNFIATSIDMSYGALGGNPGITAIYSVCTESGFLFTDPLPIYPASGNRSWAIGITPDRTTRYIHQVYYSGGAGSLIEDERNYDVGVLDLSTNDLGQNVISVVGKKQMYYGQNSFGSYTSFRKDDNHAEYVLGKDIYISLPPATQGNNVYFDDWGGPTTFTRKAVYIYSSPDGYDGDVWDMAFSSSYPDKVYINHTFIVEGEDYSTTVTYTITDVGIRDFLIDYPHDLVKFIRTGETTFCAITLFGNWAKFDISTLSVVEKRTIPQPVVDGHQFDTYVGSAPNAFGAADGYFLIQSEAVRYWQPTYNTYEPGYGFFRVIDIRTGDIIYYYPIVPPRLPARDGGPGYVVDLVGYDESPNHFVAAYAATNCGGAIYIDKEGEPSDEPRTLLYIFSVNKYTGAVHCTETKYIWRCEEFGCDGWATPHWSGLDNYYTSDKVGGRNSFLKFMQEDIDGGFGTVMMCLSHVLIGLKETWEYFLMPPWWFWGLHYQGTYWENCIMYLGIPGGYPNGENSYIYYEEGNPNTDPVIPDDTYDDKPVWLHGYDGYSIKCLYSRLMTAPVVWRDMAISSDWNVTDTATVLASPYSPGSYLQLCNNQTEQSSPFYHVNFNQMMDDVDDTIYFSSAKAVDDYGRLYGCTRGGVITKIFEPIGGNSQYSSTNIAFANKIAVSLLDNYYRIFKGFYQWPGLGSGVIGAHKVNKILIHPINTIESGSFNTLFEYKNQLAVETGLGLPTAFFDPPISTTGWLYHDNCTVLGASWTNTQPVPTMVPNTYMTEGRLFDIFQGANFPLAPGYSLPDNYMSRFLGTVDSANNTIKIFNTEYDTNEDMYSVIHFFPVGWDVTHVDFTNFFPSPYIFSSPINPASGQQFYQRYTEGDIFYNLSFGLPEGSLITTIRADDRM